MRLLTLFLLGLSLLLPVGSLWANDGLTFIDPWVRQAPPTAKNLAGYGEFKNTSTHSINIIGLTSALFEKVEMHITTFKNGMMRMSEVKTIVLKAGESIYFEPGGRHLMMIKPKQPIKAGLIVPVAVTLTSGVVMHFDMQVRR